MLQIRKQKVRNEMWIQNEIQVMENPDRYLYSPEYQQADKKLQETYQPDHILCRDQQKQRIKKFVLSALEKQESKESLYIAGVPGIGKTLCVKTCMQKLKQNKQKFKYIYLNAMKINRANDIFKQIYIELTSHKQKNIGVESAMYNLDDLFRKAVEPKNYPGISKIMKIIVIDQIDYLITKDQEILYNIFDWTQSRTSKLAIIAISNTLNFPETLKTKIMSRIGNNRLTFTQYKSNQVAQILRQRVEKAQVFDQKAIDLISKRLVKSTSDIRKCLSLLRDSLYYHATSTKSHYQVRKVPYSCLQLAYQKMYKDPFTEFFKKMPKVYKQILLILVNHFRRESYSMCFRTLCFQTALEEYKIDKQNTKEAVLQLADLGVITIRYSKNYSTHFQEKMKNLQEQQIYLKVDIEKVRTAINEDTSCGLKID